MAFGKHECEVFKIEYFRQGKTNQWKAKTTKSQGPKENCTERVLGPFIAKFEEQTKADENHATFQVYVKRDPRYFDLSPEFEEARISMIENANALADKEFLKRHPEAKIEHGEG